MDMIMNKYIKFFVVAIVLVGCSDKTPNKLVVNDFPSIIYDKNSVKISSLVSNRNGDPIPDLAITYQVNPPTIAEVSNNGDLKCKSSGDATALLNGGGLSILLNVKCRLVSKIEVPSRITLQMGLDQQAPKPSALNENNEVLSDVVISEKVENSTVARIDNEKIIPTAMGKTKINYVVGSITAITDVIVGSVETNSLLLTDGQIQSFTLPKGSYEFDIQVSPINTSGGVGVVVTSTGVDCNRPEMAQHHIECNVPDTATVTIANPTTFGMGSPMSGFVKIIKWPSE